MRYFVEVSYKGTRYAGFQVQQNGDTIQGQVEKALTIVCRFPVTLTGSSRTDAGVHALQNYFHFDIEKQFDPSLIYNINALLPLDIVVKSIIPVPPDAHSRFLATSRKYKYHITTTKNPFLTEAAWYYPFSVDFALLNQAANLLYRYTDYTSFSKRNTQVLTKECTIIKSEWILSNCNLEYTVEANRFLRGMVRGLVGTMLLVGRKKISLEEFAEIIQVKDCTRANFATPAHGLFLVAVRYPFLPASNDNI
ncbi:tRNA pseudouridine(38-40) synthase TruA [Segetibacter sp.]|jgi:tRNA pseudouridine38-40 synthase|uniref:tRNA pseudouridine(38-40) synthase TruA n=1 Tax=Segetibacter sp. TaxID=2231182 RepID=UPI0026300144|nr:tRNA pseudouridine(38-40) synthase TruA [Segetibacter sp.]MCW3080373.1 tRNA pseudouridine synthase [Segetibacter sp.]